MQTDKSFFKKQLLKYNTVLVMMQRSDNSWDKYLLVFH